MSQSHSSILVHVIFSTKNRIPFLSQSIREDLFKYLTGTAHEQGVRVHAIGGIEDHIHLLVTLPRTKTLAGLVESLKTRSSKWLKTLSAELESFAWQMGYGGFSVSFSQMEAVCRYIRNQENHHRRMQFQDELKELFRRHEIEFDDQYLWT